MCHHTLTAPLDKSLTGSPPRLPLLSLHWTTFTSKLLAKVIETSLIHTHMSVKSHGWSQGCASSQLILRSFQFHKSLHDGSIRHDNDALNRPLRHRRPFLRVLPQAHDQRPSKNHVEDGKRSRGTRRRTAPPEGSDDEQDGARRLAQALREQMTRCAHTTWYGLDGDRGRPS
ncbi:hypothetical protein BKA80DRAFT_77502 [Phyllosticta citrichinensis]